MIKVKLKGEKKLGRLFWKNKTRNLLSKQEKNNIGLSSPVFKTKADFELREFLSSAYIKSAIR